MGIGIAQLGLIVVVVLVIFGADKLSGVGKAVGKSVREFKEEVKVDDSFKTSTENDSKENE